MAKTKFLRYIHFYRGFAILMIVAGHVFASLDWGANQALAKKIDIAFFDNVSIIFLFISGFLFQHLIAKFKYKKYLWAKFRFIILPYILISLPVIFIRIAIDKPTSFLLDDYPEFSSFNPLYQVGFYLATGAHLRPFWFIPMITIFYLISPLFKILDQYPKAYIPILIVAFALSFIIPRHGSTDTLLNFLHFLSVYVFGMFVSKHKSIFINLLNKQALVATLILLLMTTISIQYPSTHISFVHKLYCAVFFFFTFWKTESLFENKLARVADFSFGIFFLHDYFDLFYKVVLEKLFNDPLIKGNYVLFFLMFLLIISLCILTIKLVKNLLGEKSRYLIGC